MTWVDTPWQRPQDCTCLRVWHGVTQPPPCPVHGGRPYLRGELPIARKPAPKLAPGNRAIRADDV